MAGSSVFRKIQKLFSDRLELMMPTILICCDCRCLAPKPIITYTNQVRHLEQLTPTFIGQNIKLYCARCIQMDRNKHVRRLPYITDQLIESMMIFTVAPMEIDEQDGDPLQGIPKIIFTIHTTNVWHYSSGSVQ